MFGASTPFFLTAPPTPTLFSVFAFNHRRSPFLTGVCTPSIRCLYNSSLSILTCIGKVFAYCLYQEHKRLRVVQLLHSLCSELHLGTLFLLTPVVSLQYLVESYGYSCTISMCPRAISILQISPYSLLMFDSSSSCHNTCPSQNRVPIFISFVVFLFHYQGLHQFSHREITVTESNFFGEITTSSDPLNIRNPIVPLCYHPASLQSFHYKLLYIQK